MGPNGIYPRILMKGLAKLHSITYHQSWLMREMPNDWRLGSVAQMYNKGQKEDLGNYRPVNISTKGNYEVVHLGYTHMSSAG